MSAKEAFKAFVRAYDSHQLKTIFDIQTLDLGKLALSFGFKVPPNVDLSELIIRSTKADRPRKRQGNLGDTRNANGGFHKNKRAMVFRQVGPKKQSDKRQFSRWSLNVDFISTLYE